MRPDGAVVLDKVSLGFGPTFTLKIPLSGITILTGPSGSGKSLLINYLLIAESRRKLELLNAFSLNRFDRERVSPALVAQGSISSLPLCIGLSPLQAETGSLTIGDIIGVNQLFEVKPTEASSSTTRCQRIVDSYLDCKIAITSALYSLNTPEDLAEITRYADANGVSHLLIGNRVYPLEEVYNDLVANRLAEATLCALVVDRCSVSQAQLTRMEGSLSFAESLKPSLSPSADENCTPKFWRLLTYSSHVEPLSEIEQNANQSQPAPESVNELFSSLKAAENTNVKVLARTKVIVEAGMGTYPLKLPLNHLSYSERVLFRVLGRFLANLPKALFAFDLPSSKLPDKIVRAISCIASGLVQDGSSVLLVDTQGSFKQIANHEIELTRQYAQTTNRHRVVPLKLLQATLARSPHGKLDHLQAAPPPRNTSELHPGADSRATVGSLLGIFAPIRTLFLSLPLSNERNLKGKSFRHNSVDHERVADVFFKGFTFTSLCNSTMLALADIVGTHPRLRRIFALFPHFGLSHLSPAREFCTLSSGEQERLVLLKMALVMRPFQVWVVEEFGANLEESESERIVTLLSYLRADTNTTVVCR